MFKLEDAFLTVLSWIHCLLLTMVVFLFVSCLPFLPEAEAIVYYRKSLWILIPVIASWYMVRRIKGFLLYLSVGAAVTAVTGFLSKDWIIVVLSVFVILMRSYPRIVRGKMLEEYPGEIEEIEIWEIPTFMDRPKMIPWMFCSLIYLVIIISKRHMLLMTMFYVLLAAIFVCYMFASASRMKEFITKNRRIANLPVKTMQLMQRSVLCVTLFILLLFVLPSIIYGEEPLTVLSEIEIKQTATVQVEMPSGQEGMGGMEAMLEMIGAQEIREWPEWVQKLMNALVYLVASCGAAAIAFLLYQAFRRMMHDFAGGHGEDEIILLEGEETEMFSGLRKRREGMLSRTPAMKIRKEYKKLIRKRLKTNPFGSETPQELEQNAEVANESFHILYEKARYTQDGCSKEDLEQFLHTKEELKRGEKAH